jgi:hypothetical protein
MDSKWNIFRTVQSSHIPAPNKQHLQSSGTQTTGSRGAVHFSRAIFVNLSVIASKAVTEFYSVIASSPGLYSISLQFECDL